MRVEGMKCQQVEVYAAETIGGAWEGSPIAEDRVQDWVDALRENPYWEVNFPDVFYVETFVVPERETGTASFNPDTGVGHVELNTPSLVPTQVLHEVSHVLAEARYESHAHDPWWARTYLEVLSVYIGPWAYLGLRDAFDELGVDYEHGSTALPGIELGGER